MKINTVKLAFLVFGMKKKIPIVYKFDVYFLDPNNDKEALNLEVRGNCTFHWFKDSVHIIPLPPNNLFLHTKVGSKYTI